MKKIFLIGFFIITNLFANADYSSMRFEGAKVFHQHLASHISNFRDNLQDKYVQTNDEKYLKLIKKIDNKDCSIELKSKNEILFQCNKQIASLTLFHNADYFLFNGKQFKLSLVSNFDQLQQTLQESLEESSSHNKTTFLFDAIFPKANAFEPFSLMALGVYFLATGSAMYIDMVISSFSEEDCKKRLESTKKKLLNLRTTCQEDINQITSGVISREASSSYQYIETIQAYLKERSLPNKKVSSCQEAVKENHKFWEMYHFRSCVAEKTKKEASIAGLICENLSLLQTCLLKLSAIDSDSINQGDEHKRQNLSPQEAQKGSSTTNTK